MALVFTWYETTFLWIYERASWNNPTFYQSLLIVQLSALVLHVFSPGFYSLVWVCARVFVVDSTTSPRSNQTDASRHFNRCMCSGFDWILLLLTVHSKWAHSAWAPLKKCWCCTWKVLVRYPYKVCLLWKMCVPPCLWSCSFHRISRIC